MIHIIPKLYIRFKMMPYNAKQFHLSSRSLTSPSLSCNSGTVCIKCALYTCTVPNLFLVLENYILPFQIVLPSQQDLPLPLLQFLHILQSASWQPNPLQRTLQIFQQLVLISILVISNEWPFWWRGVYISWCLIGMWSRSEDQELWFRVEPHVGTMGGKVNMRSLWLT